MPTNIIDEKIEEIEATIKDLPNILSLADLVEVYNKVIVITEIEKALSKQILIRLKAGEKHPDIKLVRTRGRASVTEPDTLARRLAKYTTDFPNLELDIFDVLEPKSITKLKDYIDQDDLNDLIDGLMSDGKVGKDYDFAPHDDSRPEVTYTKE